MYMHAYSYINSVSLLLKMLHFLAQQQVQMALLEQSSKKCGISFGLKLSNMPVILLQSYAIIHLWLYEQPLRRPSFRHYTLVSWCFHSIKERVYQNILLILKGIHMIMVINLSGWGQYTYKTHLQRYTSNARTRPSMHSKSYLQRNINSLI